MLFFNTKTNEISYILTIIYLTGFYSCNTEIMPGINNWTSEIQVNLSLLILSKYNVSDFRKFLLNVFFLPLYCN